MNKLVLFTALALLPLVSPISGEETKASNSTTRPRLNKGFKPKFVRILTQDDIKKSGGDNVRETLPRKFSNRNKIGSGRYGAAHANSPIQMIYKVEEVPIEKVKPLKPSEPYVGPKLRPADGAYPVYYSGANANGKFGKSINFYTIREFRKLVHSS